MWSGSARAKVLRHPSVVIVMAEFLTERIYSYTGVIRRLLFLSFQSNHYYVKPRVTDHQFGIRHYAGEVGVHGVRCLVYTGCVVLQFKFQKSGISPRAVCVSAQLVPHTRSQGV